MAARLLRRNDVVLASIAKIRTALPSESAWPTDRPVTRPTTGMRAACAHSSWARRHRWISDDRLKAVAALLDMAPDELEGVATFYNLIFRRPVGRHVIRVCDSMTCYVGGHESVVAEMQKQLGIGLGQTTADNRFTLLPVCCLGNCDKAPAVMIDDDTFGDVQAEGVAQLLEAYQ